MTDIGRRTLLKLASLSDALAVVRPTDAADSHAPTQTQRRTTRHD